jgi:hypothetical protein
MYYIFSLLLRVLLHVSTLLNGGWSILFHMVSVDSISRSVTVLRYVREFLLIELVHDMLVLLPRLLHL